MCKITHEVGSQKCKAQMKIWQSTNLGEFRSKIKCESDGRKRLRESVRKKIPELWPDKWILHHENAPAYAALRVSEFMDFFKIKKVAWKDKDLLKFLTFNTT
jgi:hypothetical protein